MPSVLSPPPNLPSFLLTANRDADDPSQDPQIRCSARRTVFVGRLDFVTNEDTLRTTFERFGPVHHLRLVRDIGTPLWLITPRTIIHDTRLTRADSHQQQ